MSHVNGHCVLIRICPLCRASLLHQRSRSELAVLLDTNDSWNPRNNRALQFYFRL